MQANLANLANVQAEAARREGSARAKNMMNAQRAAFPAARASSTIEYQD